MNINTIQFYYNNTILISATMNSISSKNDGTNEKQGDSSNSPRVLLPSTFSPSVNEVMIGRGRKVANHSGNARFQEIIYSHLMEYSRAKTKAAKSEIILRVLLQVRENSHVGGFIKRDSKTKRYFILEETAGRVSTAQAFRDALSSNYRSSKQYKQQKRWDEKCPDDENETEETPAPASSTFPDKPGMESRNVVFPLPSIALSHPPSYDNMSVAQSMMMAPNPFHRQTMGEPPHPPRFNNTPKVTMSGLRGVLDSALNIMEHEDTNDLMQQQHSQFHPSMFGGSPHGGFQMGSMLDDFEAQAPYTVNPFEPTPLTQQQWPVAHEEAATMMPLAVPTNLFGMNHMMPMASNVPSFCSQVTQQEEVITSEQQAFDKFMLSGGIDGDDQAASNGDGIFSLREAMGFPI